LSTFRDHRTARSRLPNGAHVLVTPVPHARSVSIIAATRIGSGFESLAEQGISHFVEHMLFKGTDRRPSYTDIAASVERLGGMINALTEPEMTVIWAKVAAPHWRSALDVITDMIGHSRFDAGEIEKERRVILDEIGMTADVPEESVRRSLRARLWHGHGLGREVAGTPAILETFTPDQMRAHARRMFSGANLVVSLAGDLDPGDGAAAVRTGVEGRPAGREAVWPVFAPDGPPSPRAVLDSREADHAYFGIAGRAVSRDDTQRYDVDVLTAILGEGMGSRLFEELRERRGIVYEVLASVTATKDSGAMVIEAATEPDTLHEAMQAVLDELAAVRDYGVTADEVDRAREVIKGEIQLSMEDTYAVAGWALREQLLETEPLTPDGAIAKYDGVSAASVVQAARRLFSDDWPIVAASGPIDDDADIPHSIDGASAPGF